MSVVWQRVRVGCATILVVSASARVASGSPAADVDFEWEGPGDCPARSDVLLAISRLLPHPEAPTKVHVHAAATHDEGAWRLRIRTGTEDDVRERTLAGDSCAELADAAALIVALAIDPAASSPRKDADTSTVAPAAAAPSASRADHTTAPPTASGPRLRAFASALGALDAAALPSAAPGFGGSIGALVGRVRAEAYGILLPSQRSTISGGDVGGDVSLVAGGVRFGYAALDAPVEIVPEIGFEAGQLSASSFGVLTAGSGTALWVAPELGVLGGYALARNLDLVLTTHALVPVSRERFIVVGLGEVHRPPAVTVRAALGLEVRLP